MEISPGKSRAFQRGSHRDFAGKFQVKWWVDGLCRLDYMSGNVHVKKTFRLVKNYLLVFLDVQHFVGFLFRILKINCLQDG